MLTAARIAFLISNLRILILSLDKRDIHFTNSISQPSRLRLFGSLAKTSLCRDAPLLLHHWDRGSEIVANHGVHLVFDLVEARHLASGQGLGELVDVGALHLD